jgi:hypothetical protein
MTNRIKSRRIESKETHYNHPFCECSICISPTRIQFVCHDRLVAEVIVEHHMADQTVSDYYHTKHKNGEAIGASIMNRSDVARFWNVPIGAKINRTIIK